MWIWWKLFTGFILPEDNVWIPSLICGGLGLPMFASGPFIAFRPFAVFVPSILYFLPLPKGHTCFPLLRKWWTLIHFWSLGIDFSWRIILFRKVRCLGGFRGSLEDKKKSRTLTNSSLSCSIGRSKIVIW